MKQSAKEVLAMRLRQLRQQRGWTQNDLAANAGLHPTYIAALERSEQSIGIDEVEQLAMAFKLPIHLLFKDQSETERENKNPRH